MNVDLPVLPKAVVHATYSADITEAIGRVVGPNTIGELLQIVECAPHPDKPGKWRVGFSYVLPSGLGGVA